MVLEGACACRLIVARASKQQTPATVALPRHRRNILRVSSCLITVSNATFLLRQTIQVALTARVRCRRSRRSHPWRVREIKELGHIRLSRIPLGQI